LAVRLGEESPGSRKQGAERKFGMSSRNRVQPVRATETTTHSKPNRFEKESEKSSYAPQGATEGSLVARKGEVRRQSSPLQPPNWPFACIHRYEGCFPKAKGLRALDR
jgi:hypothetical protein